MTWAASRSSFAASWPQHRSALAATYKNCHLLPLTQKGNLEITSWAAAMDTASSNAESFDRSQFDSTITVKALRLQKQLCNKYMKQLRSFVLAVPKMKCVLNDAGDELNRILLLQEGVQDTDLPQVTVEALKADGVEWIIRDVRIKYEHLSTEAVLKKLLPEGLEVPGSFETVGHIAHLNLRDEHLPFKTLIGQVIIDKNSCIKTVVNKVGILENQYRTLPLEVIAGENRLEAVVNQHKTRFKLNYAEVYWNSRLEEEHLRLVRDFNAGEVIADVMAGVGPFTIPAAQMGLKVYANDLNPRSCHYLRENAKLNKVQHNVHTFEMDGRHFIRQMGGSQANHQIRDSCAEAKAESTWQNGAATPQIPEEGVVYHHAIMNLPASAVNFLDAFKGSFNMQLWQSSSLPLIHVYTFAKNAEEDAEIQERVQASLGGHVESSELRIRLVRDVAPNKRMVCVSFRMPPAIAFDGQRAENSTVLIEQHTCKKQKVDS